MNSNQTNKLSMYLAVQAVLEAHQDAWQSLAGFAAGATELDENIASIQTLAQTQSQKNGASADKAQAFEELVDAAFEVAAATKAFATAGADNELAAKVNYSRSDVASGRDSLVVARCRSIYDEANAVVSSLADYGITPAKLTAFKKKTDAFQSAQVKPRQGRATSSAATKAMPELFALTDELLNDRLDGLAIQFRDSQPAFYGEYTTARVIVDLPGGRASKESKSPPPANAVASTAA
jgi:hypothetical protein